MKSRTRNGSWRAHGQPPATGACRAEGSEGTYIPEGRRNFPESAYAGTMDRRPGASYSAMEHALPTGWRSLSSPRPDASYVRFDVVDGGRVAAVGRRANGSYSLDVHGAGLLPMDTQGCWGCGIKGDEAMGVVGLIGKERGVLLTQV